MVSAHHRKLKAFQLADALAVAVYQTASGLPKDEVFGLWVQMWQAAVSTASHIVEGCARHTRTDYLHFLDVAFGSFRELDYQISLAHRLGHFRTDAHGLLQRKCTETSKVLPALMRSLRPAAR